MINFFRRILKKLADDNKFSKYLIYAIGEIVLLMIGILLALQANNWNGERINRSFENSYLLRLKILKVDVSNLTNIDVSQNPNL